MLGLWQLSLEIFLKCSASLKDMFWQWDRFNWVRPLHVSISNLTGSTEISQHHEIFIDLNFNTTEDCTNCAIISSLKCSMPERSSSWNSAELDKIVVRCSSKGLCWVKWQLWRFRVLSFGQAWANVKDLLSWPVETWVQLPITFLQSAMIRHFKDLQQRPSTSVSTFSIPEMFSICNELPDLERNCTTWGWNLIALLSAMLNALRCISDAMYCKETAVTDEQLLKESSQSTGQISQRLKINESVMDV